MRIPTTSLLLVASAPAALGLQITQGPTSTRISPSALEPAAVFLGPAGGFGEVRTYDVSTGSALDAPAGLRDLRLLTIDFVGRTELEAFAPDRPRRFDDVPGASRLQLPEDAGNLYKFERRIATGVSVFGFLLVDVHGQPRVAAEVPGIGGAGDPFVGRIAVAPDGRCILAATVPAAGGDLLEVDLLHGTVVDRTAHVAALDLSDAALWLNPEWGFGVCQAGIQRFRRAPGALANEVGFGQAPPPSWFAGEAVVSRNRAWAITTAGTGPGEQFAFVFGPTGDARRVGAKPERLSTAGFLPESLAGPFMAVSDDGALCAYRREGILPTDSREAFMARTQPLPGEEPEQVTHDDYFIDTVDQVGAITFFEIDQLTMGMGEEEQLGLGGLEKMDLFEVRLPAPDAPVFTNVTLSSGDATAPFESPGQIDPACMHWIPATGSIVLHDGENEEVLGYRPGLGLQVLIPEVKSLEWVEPAQDDLLFSVRRAFDPRPFELYRAPATLDAAATLVFSGTPDTEFLSPASDGAGTIGTVMRIDLVGDFMLRVDVPAGTVEQFSVTPSTFIPPIGFADSGAQLCGEGPLTGPSLFHAWLPSGALHTFQAPAVPGHQLP